MIANNNQYDVTILGGGLAGLTLAKQLLMQDSSLRVAIVEKRSFPVNEAAHKVGESTVEIGAHYFAEVLQLKKHLTDQQLPKFGLRFFFKDSDQAINEGTEVGGSEFFAAPSYQVDRGRLENFLAQEVVAMGATLIAGCRVKDIQLTSAQNGSETPSHETPEQVNRTAQSSNLDSGPGNHVVSFLQDNQLQTLESRWMVDASGRASFIKRKLDISEDLHHDINAVWFRIDANIQIDQWCDCPEWLSQIGKVPRRWLSTNHLMGEGYWVWLIPLATGSTSIGIVADPEIHSLRSMNSFEKSLDWLAEFEPQCADAIEPHREKMQDFLAIKKLSRGTKQVFSTDRWGLTGEAAAFLDPFYSPGSDFIAIGNTMIAKLIHEDLAGRSIQQLAPTLQSVYLTLFHNNLLTYRDQYPLFGNPRIMALKFVWDYAIYWGFPALLYFNDKLTDVSFIQSLSKGVQEMRDMNLRMQQFFRDWYEIEKTGHADAAFVDQNEIDVMTRMNRELKEKLDDPALRKRFFDNVEICKNLMAEMMQRVKEYQPDVAIADVAGSRENYLDRTFETLNI
jgi:flavin-dependent dehydrogenase